MTLLWHNHFATSNSKVLNLTLMRAQNETLRRYCLSPFGELLERQGGDVEIQIRQLYELDDFEPSEAVERARRLEKQLGNK